MTNDAWKNISLPYNESDSIWEIYHENSKSSRYDCFPSDHFIASRMSKLYESLSYKEYPSIRLPTNFPRLNLSLEEAILQRVTTRELKPVQMELDKVAAIFYYAYGITRDKKDTKLLRSFRTVPSGGALYPLELFFFSKNVCGLNPGVYHYNPIENAIEYVIPGDLTEKISSCLSPVQTNFAPDSSLMIFITAAFERETFKYGPRGYRFVLLEAGHVAQNINLVTTAVNLGSVNIAGYFDREVDDMLRIDGITHSTIYMVAVGGGLKEAKSV